MLCHISSGGVRRDTDIDIVPLSALLDYSLTFVMFGLQTAYTIPILAFAFVCHPEVLPIYTELRE